MGRWLLLALLALAVPVGARSLPGIRLEDANFQVVGFVRADGRVESRTYDTLGFIHGDAAEDATMHRIGRIAADGVVSNASDQAVARLDAEGVLVGRDGQVVARMEGKQVLDALGHVLLQGDPEALPVRTAALYYLFFYRPSR